LIDNPNLLASDSPRDAAGDAPAFDQHLPPPEKLVAMVYFQATYCLRLGAIGNNDDSFNEKTDGYSECGILPYSSDFSAATLNFTFFQA